jgi:hypothetical protein
VATAARPSHAPATAPDSQCVIAYDNSEKQDNSEEIYSVAKQIGTLYLHVPLATLTI